MIASNRRGAEILLHEDGSEKQRISFYGKTFITDETGMKKLRKYHQWKSMEHMFMILWQPSSEKGIEKPVLHGCCFEITT